jgi:hypothetical protein
VAVPGTPLDLAADGDRAWVVMGWAGVAEVGVGRLPIEGELLAFDGPWIADRRGRWVRVDGAERLVAGWPRGRRAALPENVPPEQPFAAPIRFDGGLREPVTQAVQVGARLVGSHGRTGILTIREPGGSLRRVHLDGVVGDAPLRASGDAVWAPLPNIGAERVDLASGDRLTWRFAPGAVDVLDGEPAIAARGDFGLAWLYRDGRVEACHPGQPVQELRREGETVLARTGSAWQPLEGR